MLHYKTIAVALDGSILAEQALPHAVYLAKTLGAKLVLIRIVQPLTALRMIGELTPTQIQALEESLIDHVQRYLNNKIESLRDQGLEVEPAVAMSSNTARAIVETAQEKNADLIIMTTHGHTGLLRLVLGSITQQVLNISPLPVLVVRAQEVKA